MTYRDYVRQQMGLYGQNQVYPFLTESSEGFAPSLPGQFVPRPPPAPRPRDAKRLGKPQVMDAQGSVDPGTRARQIVKEQVLTDHPELSREQPKETPLPAAKPSRFLAVGAGAVAGGLFFGPIGALVGALAGGLKK